MRLFLLLLTAGGAAAASAPLLWSGDDFESLPPEPAQMYSELASCQTSLGAAVEAVEAALEGRVAEISYDSGDSAGYVADVYTQTGRYSVRVDGASGEIVERTAVPRLPGRAVEGAPVETDSGLQYFDLVVGDGKMPAGRNSKVKVHYAGWLVDGTEFDSSYKRNRPIEFGLNQVIPGWSEGVSTMKVGGVRKLIIPYDIAYGASGRPPTIPPKATLIFDIELLDVIGE